MRKQSVIWILLAILILSATAVAQARERTPSPDYTTRSAAPQENGFVVRIYTTDRGDLQALTAEIDVWAVYPDRGYVEAAVTSGQYFTLISRGYRVEIDRERTAKLNTPNVALPGQTAGIPGYPCYRTVEETYATAAAIVAAHPTLAQWVDVGDSWEKVNSGGSAGYDMNVLILTNQALAGPKPKLFIMGAIHAREYATAELVTRYAEYLINHYGTDPDVTWLLDYNEIHLMLQANPDGRKKAETGVLWRKNTNQNYCSPTSSNRGADLNRNYPFHWGCCGGSSGNQCDETYRGPSAVSEPETQAVVNYVRANYPDLRPDDLGVAAPVTTTGVFMDIHSYSELVMWPWGFTSSVPPNGIALQTLGRKFAYFNGYTAQQAIGLYPTDGTTDDFAYGELGVASFTFEVGTDFFQACSVFENTIYPGNLPALLYAAKSARHPYMTPAGPDSLSVTVSPTTTSTSPYVTLNAIANDTRYSSGEPTQNIAAARYTIDAPSWVTGVISYPMAASDGLFNSPIEAVQAVINTTSLTSGRHMIFVESQDAAGNWGPPTAVFVWVTIPPTGIIGTVRASDTTAPLPGVTVKAIAIDSTTVETTTNAAGLYQFTVYSGTYTLTASKYGYLPATIPNVTALPGVTTTQNITLTPALSHVVTGTVRDGLTGWPLAATIQIENYPYGSIQSNAATGVYSVTLAEGLPYTFTVSAHSIGYMPAVRSIGLVTADRVEHFALAVDQAACTAPLYRFAGVRETFANTTVPAGWSVINHSNAVGWSFSNPGSRANNTGGAGNFAIADSDQANVAMDTELRTPVMDLRGLNVVTLTFKTDFYYFSGNQAEVADVDVSADGGSTWTNVWRRAANYRGPHTETIDLTAYAAQQAHVMIRFHYYNATDEWWWQVDDVQLGQCVPVNTPLLTPPSITQSGKPGEVLTYTLTLTNAGYQTFLFDRDVNANGWPVSVGPYPSLNPGESATLVTAVTIPPTATQGLTHTTRLTMSSTGASAYSDLITIVEYAYSNYLPLIIKE